MANITFTGHGYGHGLSAGVQPFWQGVQSILAAWLQRHRERANLARFMDQGGSQLDRDLRDLGLSRSQLQFEAGKPFWRV